MTSAKRWYMLLSLVIAGTGHSATFGKVAIKSRCVIIVHKHHFYYYLLCDQQNWVLLNASSRHSIDLVALSGARHTGEIQRTDLRSGWHAQSVHVASEPGGHVLPATTRWCASCHNGHVFNALPEKLFPIIEASLILQRHAQCCSSQHGMHVLDIWID